MSNQREIAEKKMNPLNDQNTFEKLEALEHEAADFGFKWENAHQIMDQIKSECDEITEHLDSTDPKASHMLQDEIGDLLHAAFSLCVFYKFNPEETLTKSIDKFEKRLSNVKKIAKEGGEDTLNGKSFDELMEVWDRAKNMN